MICVTVCTVYTVSWKRVGSICPPSHKFLVTPLSSIKATVHRPFKPLVYLVSPIEDKISAFKYTKQNTEAAVSIKISRPYYDGRVED